MCPILTQADGQIMDARKKVLVTEGNNDFCNQLELELNKRNMELIRVEKDGIRVLEALETFRPDAAVLMPSCPISMQSV